MKQIPKMDGKPFTSSLNNAPTPPLVSTLFPTWSVDISFKDDVTVILLLDVSFLVFLHLTETNMPEEKDVSFALLHRYGITKTCLFVNNLIHPLFRSFCILQGYSA